MNTKPENRGKASFADEWKQFLADTKEANAYIKKHGVQGLILRDLTTILKSMSETLGTISQNLENLLSNEKTQENIWDKKRAYYKNEASQELVDTSLQAKTQNGQVIVSEPAETVADIKRCLANGADVNTQSMKDGYTALHYACFDGNAKAVQTLLDAGADVRIQDSMGDAPLFLVLVGMHNHPENADKYAQCASMMINAGALSTVADKDDRARIMDLLKKTSATKNTSVQTTVIAKVVADKVK